MRILVIKNNRNNRAYAKNVYALLEEIGHRNAYTVTEGNGWKSAGDNAPGNITFISLPASTVIQRYIQQWRLHAFVNKHRYNLIIQHADQYLKQKNTPQLLIADDVERLPPVKKISFSKIFLLTHSNALRQSITEKGFTNIIHVVPFVAKPQLGSISWSEQQQVKMDFTEGREYFYAPSNFHNIDEILHLLKSFSGFKKWQHSGMKLVLTGKLYVPEKDWNEKFSTYKYRDDVMMYHQLADTDKTRLLAGAYACIHLPRHNGDLQPLVDAVTCHTPVVSFDMPALSEYAGEAALSAPPGNYEMLTQQLIKIYKDENGRNKMIAACAQHASSLSTDAGVQALGAIVL